MLVFPPNPAITPVFKDSASTTIEMLAEVVSAPSLKEMNVFFFKCRFSIWIFKNFFPAECIVHTAFVSIERKQIKIVFEKAAQPFDLFVKRKEQAFSEWLKRIIKVELGM